MSYTHRRIMLLIWAKSPIQAIVSSRTRVVYVGKHAHYIILGKELWHDRSAHVETRSCATTIQSMLRWTVNQSAVNPLAYTRSSYMKGFDYARERSGNIMYAEMHDPPSEFTGWFLHHIEGYLHLTWSTCSSTTDVYSETPLKRTPLGPGFLSVIARCP